MSRAARLAVPAAAEAMRRAGILDDHGRSVFPRLEMSVSTTACGMEKGEEFTRNTWQKNIHGQTALVAHYQSQHQVAAIHQSLGFDGPVMTIANACAGGANAIGHAGDLIRAGVTDIVLAGGYEALSELVFAGFDSLQSLAPEACRPFDRGRRGLMLGEGAAFVVLEKSSHARERGAAILGHLEGYGHSTDLHHLTQPAPDGAPLEKAIRQALDQAGCGPDKIGYMNAHGTGTPFNDGAEAAAFYRVFNAAKTKLSSTKAATGHTLGAAGAIEAVFAVMTLLSGNIPPQINLLDPEPLVAGSLSAPGDKLDSDHVMSVNLGFGGSNAALAFSRS